MIKGEIHLVFRDKETGEVTKEHKQTNTITERFLNELAGTSLTTGSSDYGNFGQYLVIGGWQQPTDRYESYIYDPYALGFTEAGVTSPRWNSGNVGTGGTYAYWYEYQQRFNPPAASRDIYTVGIAADDVTTLPTNKNPVMVDAYVGLNSPCTQTPTETLDVFYRIIWDNPEAGNPTGVMQRQSYYISRRHMNNDAGFFDYGRYYPSYNYFLQHGSKMIPENFNQWLVHLRRGVGTGTSTSSGAWNAGGTAYADTGYRARIMQFTNNLTQLLGRLVGTIGHGSYYSYNYQYGPGLLIFRQPVLKTGESPIQNIFSHDATATTPFYDSGSPAQGTGSLSLNGDNWTNPDFNKLFRVDITTGGNVGTAEYKFSVRNVAGFINNTYVDDHVPIPFINENNQLPENKTYFDYDDNDPDGNDAMSEIAGPMAMPYDGTRFLSFTHNWIGRTDIITGKKEVWDVNTTPSIDFQYISQLVVDTNKDIWVADALTGLHKISSDGSTSQTFDTTHPSLSGLLGNECYGVATTPNKIWAVFNGGLVSTSDGGVTFTVYDSTTTPSFTLPDFNRCWYLQGDPSHADDRLAIAYNTASTPGDRATIEIRWWDVVNGHGSTTPVIYNQSGSTSTTTRHPIRRREVFQQFHCAPNDNIWGSRTYYNNTADRYANAFWTYNSTTPSVIVPSVSTPQYGHTAFAFWWTKDINNQDAMIYANYNSNNSRMVLVKQGGTSHSQVGDFDTYPQGAEDQYIHRFYKGIKTFLPESGIFIWSTYDDTYAKGYVMMCAGSNEAADGGEFHNVIWTDYGWDGTNWVKGNTNSKTLHSTDELLIDGVTISWNDNGGVDNYVAGDYYTVGVCDGVLIDGGVEIDHRYALYYKPTLFDLTDIDNSGVLPSSQTGVRVYLDDTERGNLIDTLGSVTYNASTNGINSSSSPWAARINHQMSDEAWLEYRYNSVDGIGSDTAVFGLADASKIGSSPTATDIDFAVKITEDTNNNLRVEVVQNGTVVATVLDPTGLGDREGLLNVSNYTTFYVSFERVTGSNTLEVKVMNKVVHTFTTTATLVPSFYSTYRNISPRSLSISNNRMMNFIKLGDSTNQTGAFDPNFWAIDGTVVGRITADQVKIDGVPVTSLTYNDYRTPLNAGEVSVLNYRGGIRFSPADAGKTITVDRYNVILNK